MDHTNGFIIIMCSITHSVCWSMNRLTFGAYQRCKCCHCMRSSNHIQKVTKIIKLFTVCHKYCSFGYWFEWIKWMVYRQLITFGTGQIPGNAIQCTIHLSENVCVRVYVCSIWFLWRWNKEIIEFRVCSWQFIFTFINCVASIELLTRYHKH